MIDFPNNPTVGQIFTAPNGVAWTWDGAKWTSGATGSGFLPLTGGTLTGPLILAADPTVALGAATKQYVDATNIRYKNRIINGDMSVDQRHSGAQIAMTNGYAIDRWSLSTNVAATKGNMGQVAIAGPGFFTYCLQWNGTTAYAVAAGDTLTITHAVEGCNFNDAWFGTPNAQPLVLEFSAAANMTGVFGGSFRNGAGTRSYPFTYTLAAANTWQKFRISIPGDTAGAWSVAANAAAAYVGFSLGAGATYSGAPGAWAATNYTSAPGAVSVVANASGQLNITGVALMVGAAAASAEPEFKKYSDNLIDCQRYYEAGRNLFYAYGLAGAYFGGTQAFHVMKRAVPTMVLSGQIYGNASSAASNPGTDAAGFTANTTAAGSCSLVTSWTADADL